MWKNYTMGIKIPKWVIALVVIGFLGILFLVYYGKDNNLRVDAANETRANQADFDNMYKTIAQKYEVNTDFYDRLKEITTAATQGNSGGSLAKFIQQNYPTMDPSLAKEVMATIEGKRNQFESHQLKLSDIKAVDDKLIGSPPGLFFLFWRKPIEIQLVTSTRTDNAFKTGKDDDVSLKRK